MREIILVGGGGHCRACADVIETDGQYAIAGVTDLPENVGRTISGYPVVGTDDDLPDLIRRYRHVLVTVGMVKSAAVRVRLFERLASLGAETPVIVSPRAWVSPRAAIGPGTIVMHDALVNAGASVGRNSIINTKALVEHDAMVGDHCHVSTGAILNGEARLGHRSFLGSNAVARDGVSIGAGCVVGCGARVVKDVPDGAIFI